MTLDYSAVVFFVAAFWSATVRIQLLRSSPSASAASFSTSFCASVTRIMMGRSLRSAFGFLRFITANVLLIEFFVKGVDRYI